MDTADANSTFAADALSCDVGSFFDNMWKPDNLIPYPQAPTTALVLGEAITRHPCLRRRGLHKVAPAAQRTGTVCPLGKCGSITTDSFHGPENTPTRGLLWTSCPERSVNHHHHHRPVPALLSCQPSHPTTAADLLSLEYTRRPWPGQNASSIARCLNLTNKSSQARIFPSGTL